MNTTCPPPDSLRSYVIGELDDSLSQEIESHLAECPACEDTVAQFDSADDTLMRHLPLAAANVAGNNGDSPNWLESLRDGPPVRQAFSPSPSYEQKSVAPQSPDSPDQFSTYELLGVLGRGGMGVVYRARHRHLNRQVALKVLSPRLMTAPEARRRFEREIQVLGGLHHPGIVMATDAGRIDEAAYLVMELIDGIDLARLVRNGGPLTIPEACEAARQMAEALAAAHQAGTVHRDVKPSNVMVDRRGRVKLLDFGLAHLNALTSESLETSLGRLLGTLDYMAPEQAGDHDQLDARADLYSLGATLFYLLTGQPPHGPHMGRSLVQQLRALAAGDPPRVSTLRADVPAELDEFLAKLLSREPERRPDSAEAVAVELAQWSGGELAKRVQESTLHAPREECNPLAPREGLFPLPLGGAGGGSSALDESHSPSAAHQSLCELLGKDPADTMVQLPRPAAGGRGRITRSVMGTLAAAAAFGFFAWGAVIILRTQLGTLRIESDVDNVEVELVDEHQATKKLEINQGGKDTILRAGRYQVRLSPAHEGLTIDKDEITLRRGEQVVAKITRTEEETTASARPEATNIGTTKVAIRESDDKLQPSAAEQRAQLWPKFVAETDAAKKLDMAMQMVNLADGTPEKQLNHLLEVGAELARVAYGREIIDFVMGEYEPKGYASNSWVIKDAGEVGERYRKLNERITEKLRDIQAETTANVLTRGVLGETEFRAAMALKMLSLAIGPIHESRPASQIVLTKLDATMDSPNWSALLLLQRWIFARNANEEQLTKLFAGLTDLAKQLIKLPPDKQTDGMKTRIFGYFPLLEPETRIPVELQRVLAELNLESIAPKIEMPGSNIGALRRRGVIYVEPPSERFAIYFGDYYGFNQRQSPYEMNEVTGTRRNFRSTLHAWPAVANAYLEERRTPPYDDGTRRVIWALGNSLRLYSDGDDWPVEQSTQILTDYLRQYYVADETAVTDQLPTELLPVPTERMLSDIVGMTGQIPDFVRTGRPKSKSVNEDNERFARRVAGQAVEAGRRVETRITRTLLDDDPYRTVEIALREAVVPRTARGPRRSTRLLDEMPTLRPSAQTPAYLLESVSRSIAMRQRSAPQPPREVDGGQQAGRQTASTTPPLMFYDPDIDSILLLAILNDLAGTDAARDGRIATLIAKDETAEAIAGMSFVRKDLRDILGSHLKSREHVKRILREMAAKSTSQALVDAIREIDPTIEARVIETTVPTSAAQPAATQPAAAEELARRSGASVSSNATSEVIYQGHTEQEWQRLFLAETDPSAKLDAASALLTFAAERPTEAQIEQVLAVGEEVIRAAYGGDALAAVFAVPTTFSTSTSNSRGPVFGGRTRDGGRRGRGRGQARGGTLGFDPDVRTTQRFEAQARQQLLTLPLERAVQQICDAAVKGPDARAAFALRLLTFPNAGVFINAGPSAAPIVFRELNVPFTGLNRSALLLIARLKFAGSTSRDEQLPILAPSLVRLAARLVEAPSSKFVDSMKDTMLIEARRHQDWPPELRRAFSQMILSKLAGNQQAAEDIFSPLTDRAFSPSGSFASQYSPTNFQPPFERRFVEAARGRLSYFLDHWVGVANAELQRTVRLSPIAERDTTMAVVASLDHVLPLLSDGDEWPVTETVEILTRLLSQYYVIENGQLVSSSAELLPAAPAQILTQIVHVTGEIPEAVLKGRPRSREYLDRLPLLKEYLEGKRDREAYANAFAGMYDEEPLEVIKLAIGEISPNFVNASGNEGPIAARRILVAASSGPNISTTATGSTGRPNSMVDPLLLLAALSKFSGESPSQDARIASLAAETRTSWLTLNPETPDPRQTGLARHLKNLLASQLRAREHAKRMLREIAAKAKSQALVDAVREIDPTIKSRTIQEAAIK